MEDGENPYKKAARKADILITLRGQEKYNPEYIPVRDVYEMIPHIDDSKIDTALEELDENEASPLDYYTEENNLNVCLSNKRETNTFITHLQQESHSQDGAWFNN